MDPLVSKAKELVDCNIQYSFPEDILMIFYAATTSLLLRKPGLTFSKFPTILQNLDIVIEDKSVLEMLAEIPDIQVSSRELEYCNISAAVCRYGFFDYDTEVFQEKRVLLFPYHSKLVPVELVEHLTHEFFHLLRYSPPHIKNNELFLKNGVEILVFDLKHNSIVKRYRSFEDSVVQKYTNEAMEQLFFYINNASLSFPSFFQHFKFDYSNYQSLAFPLGTFLLNELCKDELFASFLDDTFTETAIYSKLEQYYNETLLSPTAFQERSEALDLYQKGLYQNEKSQIFENFQKLKKSTLLFLHNSKSLTKRL